MIDGLKKENLTNYINYEDENYIVYNLGIFRF